MTVEVKTFASMSEAAAALAADRSARFFSGGTLLMRAINEGNTTIATLVRATDPAYRQIRNEGARITLGAGVRMVDILTSRAPAGRQEQQAAGEDQRPRSGDGTSVGPCSDDTGGVVAISGIPTTLTRCGSRSWPGSPTRRWRRRSGARRRPCSPRCCAGSNRPRCDRPSASSPATPRAGSHRRRLGHVARRPRRPGREASLTVGDVDRALDAAGRRCPGLASPPPAGRSLADLFGRATEAEQRPAVAACSAASCARVRSTA